MIRGLSLTDCLTKLRSFPSRPLSRPAAGASMPFRLQKPRGFTLVELLVVIAIVAILIALLLPALSAIRSRSIELRCQTNLRSMGQAMILYTQDNRGFFP